MKPDFFYHNLEKKFQLALIDAVETLKKHKEVYMIILFGSFARKDYSLRHSDIDIFVLLGKKEKNKNLEQSLKKEVLDKTLKTKAPIQLEFQYLNIEESDRSLLVKMCEEGVVLFSRGIAFTSYGALGLKKLYLIAYDLTKASQVNKNRFNRFINGYTKDKKKYKGIVNGQNVIKAGNGAVLADDTGSKKIELLAEKLDVRIYVKQAFYMPTW